MVKEWNGSFVHNSEFEPKQPQIQPTRFTGDPQGLMNSRPARVEPATENLLPGNPLSLTSCNVLRLVASGCNVLRLVASSRIGGLARKRAAEKGP